MDTATDTTQAGSGITFDDHIITVTEAAIDMFDSTCSVKIEPVDSNSIQSDEGVIIAIISLVGDVDWSVFLGLPSQTAPALALKFAGFEIPFESDDMGDAVGELTNIFAGLIKATLVAQGHDVKISLPSVIRVGSLQVLKQNGVQTIQKGYNSEVGPLWTGITAQA